MSLKTTGIAAIIIGTAIFGASGTAQAQTYAHIDRLARQLERQTDELHREVHAHFRSTKDYIHLDQDVARMERLADHIHEVAHERGSIRHLRADVEELDRLFHHIEDIIERLVRTRQIGPRTLSHFNEVMHEIDDTLHHLRDDLARLSVPQPPVQPGPVYRGPVYRTPTPVYQPFPGIDLRFRW